MDQPFSLVLGMSIVTEAFAKKAEKDANKKQPSSHRA